MNFIQSLKKLIYPEGISCIGCNNEIADSSEYGLCHECSVKKNTHFCLICGRGITGEGDFCNDCSEDKNFFDIARSPTIYCDLSKKLIHSFKIGNNKYLSKYLSRFMYDSYMAEDWDIDILTYVPISHANLKERGFNQSQLLAKDLATLVDLPVKELLLKVAESDDLAKHSKKERKEILKGSFSAKEKLHGEKVLLIDDVLTTGSTVNECARVLKHAGASKVYVLTFATALCLPILN